MNVSLLKPKSANSKSRLASNKTSKTPSHAPKVSYSAHAASHANADARAIAPCPSPVFSPTYKTKRSRDESGSSSGRPSARIHCGLLDMKGIAARMTKCITPTRNVSGEQADKAGSSSTVAIPGYNPLLDPNLRKYLLDRLYRDDSTAESGTDVHDTEEKHRKKKLKPFSKKASVNQMSSALPECQPGYALWTVSSYQLGLPNKTAQKKPSKVPSHVECAVNKNSLHHSDGKKELDLVRKKPSASFTGKYDGGKVTLKQMAQAGEIASAREVNSCNNQVTRVISSSARKLAVRSAHEKVNKEFCQKLIPGALETTMSDEPLVRRSSFLKQQVKSVQERTWIHARDKNTNYVRPTEHAIDATARSDDTVHRTEGNVTRRKARQDLYRISQTRIKSMLNSRDCQSDEEQMSEMCSARAALRGRNNQKKGALSESFVQLSKQSIACQTLGYVGQDPGLLFDVVGSARTPKLRHKHNQNSAAEVLASYSSHPLFVKSPFY